MHLYARCHEHVFAFETSVIDRLLLAEDLEPPDPPAILGVYPSAPRACLGILSVGDTPWVAWDFGILLGLPPVDAAYLLLRLPDEPNLRLALRTGRCLNVGAVAAEKPLALPPGLWVARPGCIRGAFPTRHGIGLDLDWTCLFSAHERSFARELLARAEVAGQGSLDGLV